MPDLVPLTIQDVTAQPPDQELVFFLEGQKGPSYWSPLLLLLSVWDDSTGTETDHRMKGVNLKTCLGKPRAFSKWVFPQSSPRADVSPAFSSPGHFPH